MNRFACGVVAAFALAAFAAAAEHTADPLDTVKKNVADGKAVLVDVRELDEWNDGHLKGAKHVALSDLKKGIPEADLKKSLPADRTLYLHCASGKRCLQAADILKKQGYDVRPLKDGFRDLVKSGFLQDK
jgi:rhodanese-related sulfurtransferase